MSQHGSAYDTWNQPHPKSRRLKSIFLLSSGNLFCCLFCTTGLRATGLGTRLISPTFLRRGLPTCAWDLRWRFRCIIYLRHALSFGDSVSSCISNTPSFGDSGSVYILNTPPHTPFSQILSTCPLVWRFRFIICLEHAATTGDFGASYISLKHAPPVWRLRFMSSYILNTAARRTIL